MTVEAPPAAKSGAREGGNKRRLARLAAVQALYQIDLTGVPASIVIEEWRRHRLGKEGADLAEGTTGAADLGLFANIVDGVSKRRADIDGMIGPALADGWKVERLEVVLRAILRAGVFELIARADVPGRVAINEYVDIARGFFSGREPGFVNGLLDKLARRLRPDEFDAAPVPPPPAPSDGDPGAEPAG